MIPAPGGPGRSIRAPGHGRHPTHPPARRVRPTLGAGATASPPDRPLVTLRGLTRHTASLTGAPAKALADGYTTATQKQWTQPIGFVHALFEVAAHALKQAGGPDGKKAIAQALAAAELDTVVGPLDRTKGPVKNVTMTPLVGGQWREGTRFKYELAITSNKLAPRIPAAGGKLLTLK